MTSFALFKDTKAQGSSASAESTSYVTRPLTSAVFDNIGISLAAGVLTFNVAGVFAVRVKAQHAGSSGRRFVHALHKNGVASLVASTPVQTDNISNWTSVSYNVVTMAIGDTLSVRSKTNTAAGTFAGVAMSQTTEVFTEVEIEKLTVDNHALFLSSAVAGTDGAAESATMAVRSNVGTHINTITGLSIAAGVITFPVGNFRVRSLCTHFGPSGRRFIHKLASTTASLISTGTSSNGVCNTITEALGFLSVEAVTAFNFSSRVNSTTGTPKQGLAGNLGELEIYNLIEIKKI